MTLNRPAVFLLATLTLSAAHSQVLWDQTGGCLANTGSATSSRLLRSTNVESADDFVVPAGRLWRPSKIVTQGNRSIIGGTVQVNIYPDNDEIACLIGQTCPESLPQPPALCSYTGTAEQNVEFPVGFNPFEVNLPDNFCTLGEGRYWLSLVNVNNFCGIIAPCQDWNWDESRETNGSREWAIRDIGNTSTQVTCGGFGLASQCQPEPVQSNLCFDIEGQSENELPPRADPELVVETLAVGDALKLDLGGVFIEPNNQPLTFSSTDQLDFVELDNNGVIIATPTAADANTDPVMTLRATDTSGLSDDLLLALRIIDPDNIGLDASSFASDVLLRCGNGRAGLEQGLDFSRPGDCGDGPTSACGNMPAGAVVINSQLEVQLSHPMVSDLGLRLQSPAGTEVQLMNRPNFNETAISPSGGCEESDVHAVFSDLATWSVEQQCSRPIAVAGLLEPKEPLAAFRNAPGVGNAPWTLTVDNAGNLPATFQRWCLALQIEPNGAPIYPQAQLPGSATVIDLRTEDEATVSGTIQGPDDVQWYLVLQTDSDRRFYREVDTRITPAPGQILRSHRYSNEKFAGFNPTLAIGNCSVSRELVYPRYEPTFGRDLIRVAGCGNSAAGQYTLNVAKDPAGFSIGRFPIGLGTVEGQTRDEVSGEAVGRAFVTSGGAASFAQPDGRFEAGFLVGSQTINIFHPNYLPLSLSLDEPVAEGIRQDIGAVDLTPTVYPAIFNQILFESGFE